jgi:soluble lytic murein transglycosylase
LIYQFNRDFVNARLHYTAIIEKYPDSGNVPDAIYQIGRGFAQIGEYSEAEKWFERVLEQFPEHPVAKDALNQAASVYARVNKPREAIARYQKFIEKYPSDERIERAYLNIVDILRDIGETSEALKWTAKTQEVFQGKLPEAIALFSQLRIRIAQSDWKNALTDAEKLLTFADLGGTRVPGGTNRAEVSFLKGFILENQQNFADAINAYLSIPDGRNEYYGWRATERLRALANDERAKSALETKIGQLRTIADQPFSASNAENIRQAAQNLYRITDDTEILEIIKKTYSELATYKQISNFKLPESGRKEILREKRQSSDNRHRLLADELLFLGLYDEATPELEKAESGKKGDKDFDFTLATFYKRGEIAHRTVSFIEPLWRDVPGDFQIELIPPSHAELLYPAPYIDALLKSAPERGVDPRFVLSIMRQESRFRADVKSVAAARGLMQFISTTAERIARELDKENFRQDELYYPPTAILFGSQYLANIYKMFPGQHAAVAAGYNGGEENMKRWMTRAKSDDPDRYVPEIIFAQSKDYAYKVMANYRVYRIFYDESLKLKQTFR